MEPTRLSAPTFNSDKSTEITGLAGFEVFISIAVPSPTPVKVPAPLLLNVVQSDEDKYPLVDPLACVIEIAGDVPPEETIGAVPVTPVTDPPPPVAASSQATPEPVDVNT